MRERWIRDPAKGNEWHGYALRVALGFPDTYSVGMANLGFLWVYHLLNGCPEVRCDRFFDADRQLKYGERLSTVETGRALSEYDVVAFSVPYEGGYPAIPRMLMRGGIEPRAERRSQGPLVLVGGVAASGNSEPIADFVDVVFIGEAEAGMHRLVKLLIDAKHNRMGEELRSELRKLPGLYLPSDYIHRYSADGRLEAIEAAAGSREKVESVHSPAQFEAAHSPVVTDASVFPDRFLVEASRGCPYRCRFCLAAHTSGRFRESGGVDEAVAAGLATTTKVGVIGTAFTRSAGLKRICGDVWKAGGRVSFSSVRMDAGAIELLSEIGPTLDLESIAVAPEVATRRLGRVIGKSANEDLDVFVESGEPAGLKKLRLYFLIGVPGETESDVVAIAEKVKDVRNRSGWKVTCSVTPMVPKPFTPMQWAAFPRAEELKGKAELLKRELKDEKGIVLKVESLRLTREQAILARGDRRLGPVLYEAAVRTIRSGEKVSWSALLKENGLSAEMYTESERGESEKFPWETVFHGTGREQLYGEYEKSVDAARSGGNG